MNNDFWAVKLPF